ncbi:MAG: transporter associated domain-containing protein, partial [Nitrospinota bacterium]|nr:transporter associated domain-containing protein [Nitrospinota bacterium]
GILYLRDFLGVSGQTQFDLNLALPRELLREPLIVPEGMKLDALFRIFRQERTHLAIVADEFGGVAGLVTMTDLLDEIFGEIRDEFDEEEEADNEKQPDGAFICQARVPLWDFSEQTGWLLPDYSEAHSVGGLVFTLMGHVPELGESVRYGGVEFTVLGVENTRVVRLRAMRTEEPG